MLFALFHHDQLELEYNSLSVMRYTKDLYTCYVKHIPSSFDQLAVDLYNVFRKHGSIHKCQVLTNDTAIVQYYSFKNCDKAVNELVKKQKKNKHLHVFFYCNS
jgi:pterin-4a-carbinolamine dehydratase